VEKCKIMALVRRGMGGHGTCTGGCEERDCKDNESHNSFHRANRIDEHSQNHT